MPKKATKIVYKNLDPVTHVLTRPDIYIGSVKNTEMEHYFATKEENEIKIQQKTGQINPGLHRIFIEIISNAIDNVWRSEDTDTPSTKIKVKISDDGEISVWNDGLTVHIEINEETGLYNPEMIFGRLLSGSNFNDEEDRKTSGRNGLGSKASNIFSTEFTVETFDPPSGKKYVQTWKNNMSEKGKPKITSPKLKSGYTLISFKPDYAKFGVNGLSQEMLGLMFKNVVDTAMITEISVYWNEEKIPVKSLKDYALMFKRKDDGKTFDYISLNTSDTEGVLTPSSPDTGGYRPVAFVNGIETYDGGNQVDTWSEAILRPILEKINKGVKKGNKPLTIKDIRPYFRLFLNSKLTNPTFTSQEKTKLSGPDVNIPELSVKQLTTVMKWKVIEDIKDILESKDLAALKKIEKKRGFKKIDGLDPANLAGSKHSSDCSLIICEGDSAKTFAVAGLSTGVFGKKGRDYLGVWPAKGKVLNCRGKSGEIIQKNREITDLIRALNLRIDADYTTEKDFKTLSYGRVILICDGDVDGYHITGLIINFFHYLFPTLLQRDIPFITSMRTPIIRVNLSKTSLEFYTIRDYQKYQEQHPNQKADVKYFKGLGTNTNKEVAAVFGKKMIEFVKDDAADQNLNKVFNNKMADKRKEWIEQYDPEKVEEIVSREQIQTLPISDFLNNEMILFSIDDCSRSIPNIIDGFKESHRKIFHTVANIKKLKYSGKEMKVAQLAGAVAEKTGYHHGESILYDTITKMAQDYVGSNNIPLLYRGGQFGCLDPDTEILMWSGCTKKAKEIITGDRLVGDDGNVRNVLAITNGIDDMYKINTGRETYTVNSKHILTLKLECHLKVFYKKNSWSFEYVHENKIKSVKVNEKSFKRIKLLSKKEGYQKILEARNKLLDTSDMLDIKLEDYLLLSNTIKKKLISVSNTSCINWPKKNLAIDPYIMGICDSKFQKLPDQNNLHIPVEYLTNDADSRLKLLAGMIDANGCLKFTKKTPFFEISMCRNIINSLEFVARSLGFYTSISENKNNTPTIISLRICGDNLELIPTKVQSKKIIEKYKIERNFNYCIDVEPLGKGQFCGWMVDKNERFLLKNFVVTHNSRCLNGSDASSGRYIFTKLDIITKFLFKPEDNCLLNYIVEEGDKIEPEFFVPILPMILINRTIAAIGTGWSSQIPGYNPLDLVACVRAWLNNECFNNEKSEEDEIKAYVFPEITPWYRGFLGTIEKVDKNKYITNGVLTSKNSNTVIVSELPVGMSTEKFKDFCDDLLEAKNIKGYKNYSTDTKVEFHIQELSDGIECTIETLKLTTSLSTNNMVLFNEKRVIKKYDNVDEIMENFCIVRYSYYVKRKESIITRLELEHKILANKMRFLTEVMAEELEIKEIDEDILAKTMKHRGYFAYEEEEDSQKEEDEENQTKKKKVKEVDGLKNYRYLLAMNIRSFTKQKIENLQKELDKVSKELKIVLEITPAEMWTTDLEEFETEYLKYYV